MTLSLALRHRFGDFALDLRFEAPPGITVLFGRSGAGKSSVVQAVAGLLRPQDGRISLGAEVLFDSKARIFVPPHRRRIGYVFQDARLFPHLSLRQNLFYGRWFNRSARGIAPEPLFDLLGLVPLMGRRVADLSGGEAARVALGRALLSAPQLLLLDEPLAALDSARKAEVLPYLERLRDELKLPMLYVTHSPTEALRLATTMVLLEAGQLIAFGPPEAVFSAPCAAQVLGPAETGAVLRGRLTKLEADGLWRCETAAGPLWVAASGQTGDQLRMRVPAEDVFLSLSRPEGLSALNMMPARVESLTEEPSALLVRLALEGGEVLLSRVTRRSGEAMGLRAGLPLYAVMKTLRPLRDERP